MLSRLRKLGYTHIEDLKDTIQYNSLIYKADENNGKKCVIKISDDSIPFPEICISASLDCNNPHLLRAKRIIFHKNLEDSTIVFPYIAGGHLTFENLMKLDEKESIKIIYHT